MKLLIDMGNSRLKWTLCHAPDSIGEVYSVTNGNVTATLLTQAWRQLVEPETIVISQVSSHQLADRVSAAATRLWPACTVIFAKSTAQAFGVRNAYSQPEKLGVDRWLCMIAAYRRYPSGFCLVDCGTAITLDVVDASGQHQGGLICPGLALMQSALATGTANLASTTKTFPPGLAGQTAAAIYNGSMAAACGLIEHTMTNFSPVSRLLITGGDASIIANRLNTPAVIEPALVFLGLAMLSSTL